MCALVGIPRAAPSQAAKVRATLAILCRERRLIDWCFEIFNKVSSSSEFAVIMSSTVVALSSPEGAPQSSIRRSRVFAIFSAKRVGLARESEALSSCFGR